MTSETTIGIDERELDDAALEALAEAYATPPPEALRARLIGSIERERSAERAVVRVRRARIVGTIAAGVALVFAGLFAGEVQRGGERTQQLAAIEQKNTELAQQNTELAQQNGALAARIDEQGRTLAGLRDALDAQAQVLRLVGGPRMLTATLAPQKGVTGAGRVLVDATSGDAAIVLSGLAPADEGKTYELWAIRGKKAPEPAGLIAVADVRGGVVRVPSVPRASEVTAFAVSIEPKGGSTSPTGPIVLVGAVSG
jgi:anti-sigma-K factor RskA